MTIKGVEMTIKGVEMTKGEEVLKFPTCGRLPVAFRDDNNIYAWIKLKRINY